MWNVAGSLLALAVAATAWRCSRASGGYYDRDVYAMDASAHRRYALLSLAFAGYFAIAYALRSTTAGIAGLALYALIAVLYATSFLRGASDE
ncbi:MAG: hypothetical protein JOZ77_06515 [Candidatus Eremiobacteraeota bacterium]|nr:hypothetical protein [Candidatus Eremiobacteraeota bacterium]